MLGIGLALVFVAALPALATETNGDRFTVCSITINSDDEIRTFRDRLPGSKFRFVELTDFAASAGDDWFGNACASGVSCDVVVLSAHFGNTYAGNYGTTFAGRSGHTLPLEELEKRRCSDSCSGILEDPLEVFLLGCKTLSTTLEGERLSDADVALLGADGVTPEAAERLHDEVRLGADGGDNRSRMRFVFSGVPHLYGFTEVGPSGRQAAPLLEQYLADVGGYAAHLEGLRAREPLGRARPDNHELAEALEPTCFAETRGFDSSEEGARRGQRSCALRDPRIAPARGLAEIERRLAEPEVVSSLPSIAAYVEELDRGALAPIERAALDRIRTADARTRTRISSLVDGLESPILRLELLRAALSLGWISAAEALPTQRQVAIDLLSPPVWGEARDRICGLGPEVLRAIDVRAEEVPLATYGNEFGIQALECLRPSDERIHARLAQSLYDARDWIARLAAAALRATRSQQVDVQIALAEQLGRSDAAARAFAAEALRTLAPSDPRVLSTIRTVDPSFVVDWP